MMTGVTQSDEAKPSEGAVYCPACGYDLRSRSGDVCPECGAVVDEGAMRRAQVPWAIRREIGGLRALWRTVGRVTFRTKQFCYAVSQPVDYADARRFRRVVVMELFAVLAAVAVVVSMTPAISEWWEEMVDQYGWSIVVVGVGLIALAVWLFLYCWTGVHTYWFHPRHLGIEQQNRALALSYYACAPLLLTPAALPLLVAGALVGWYGDEMRSMPLTMLGVGIHVLGWAWLAFCVAAFWRVAFMMAGLAADRGEVGRWSLLLTLPVIWLLLAVFVIAGLPFVVGYVWLMVVAM